MAQGRLGEAIGRGLDMAVAAVAILFTMPLLFAIALIVRLGDGGPALFAHERVGKGGRTFRCLKFRTMAVDADARLQTLLASDPHARAEWLREQKLRNDPRITPAGQFLRRSSLDELPQLFNILKGDMSLVGPRPIVRDEIARYGKAFRYYCAVRPGLTGLWQVSGRNDVSYRRRVAMDVAYVQSKCLTLDLRILLRTIPAVLLRKGSY